MKIKLNQDMVPGHVRPVVEQMLRSSVLNVEIEWLPNAIPMCILSMSAGLSGQKSAAWSSPGEEPAPMIDATDDRMHSLEERIRSIIRNCAPMKKSGGVLGGTLAIGDRHITHQYPIYERSGKLFISPTTSGFGEDKIHLAVPLDPTKLINSSNPATPNYFEYKGNIDGNGGEWVSAQTTPD